MSRDLKHSYKTETVDALTLSVCNCGHQKCRPLHQWGPGVRSHYLIHHVVAGAGCYVVGGREFHLKKGDTFLVYPDTEITYYADENDPWEYYWVGFRGGTAAHILAHTDFTEHNPVVSIDFGDRLKRALAHIYHARGDEFAASLRMSGYLNVALGMLVESSQVTRHERDSANDYAQRAEEYLRNNYAQPISVTDVAEYVGISRSHLYRVFSQKYNMSPKEYLSAVRVGVACELLGRTTLPIGTVANSVGFEDHLYFSRVFRKLKGVTPTQYRKE